MKLWGAKAVPGDLERLWLEDRLDEATEGPVVHVADLIASCRVGTEPGPEAGGPLLCVVQAHVVELLVFRARRREDRRVMVEPPEHPDRLRGQRALGFTLKVLQFGNAASDRLLMTTYLILQFTTSLAGRRNLRDLGPRHLVIWSLLNEIDSLCEIRLLLIRLLELVFLCLEINLLFAEVVGGREVAADLAETHLAGEYQAVFALDVDRATVVHRVSHPRRDDVQRDPRVSGGEVVDVLVHRRLDRRQDLPRLVGGLDIFRGPSSGPIVLRPKLSRQIDRARHEFGPTVSVEAPPRTQHGAPDRLGRHDPADLGVEERQLGQGEQARVLEEHLGLSDDVVRSARVTLLDDRPCA